MWKLKGHVEEMIRRAEALNIKYAGSDRAETLDTKDAVVVPEQLTTVFLLETLSGIYQALFLFRN